MTHLEFTITYRMGWFLFFVWWFFSMRNQYRLKKWLDKMNSMIGEQPLTRKEERETVHRVNTMFNKVRKW